MAKRIYVIIKTFPRKIFLLFSGPPQRYWGVAVLFFFFLFLMIFTFDVLLHLRVTTREPIEIAPSQSNALPSIDEALLEAASDALLEKKRIYNEVLNAPVFEDPSI